jgi:hypothetical protein
MVEAFLLKMLFVVFSEDFNLTPQVVVRALNQLERTVFFVSIKELALDLDVTLVIALDYLKKAPLVMVLEVLVDDN